MAGSFERAIGDLSKRVSRCETRASALILFSRPLFTEAVARDIYKLNPELQAWVLHVLCFIVPRQIVELGDPTRRSCDACEALGSMFKADIRFRTCRRRTSSSTLFSHRSQNGKTLWSQTFKVGYIEQAFKRASVRAELLHGEANLPYLGRKEHRILGTGKASTSKQRAESSAFSIKEAIEAPWVWTKEAALAVWS